MPVLCPPTKYYNTCNHNIFQALEIVFFCLWLTQNYACYYADFRAKYFVYKFCLSQHVVDSSYLVSVLFREVFSHPYISFFHLLVNAFSVIIIIVERLVSYNFLERICRITDRILRSVE